MAILNPIASNWSRAEREKLNNNWTIIESYLSNLQGQINLLTGDVDVQALIDQINDILNKGNVVVEDLEAALQDASTVIANARNATTDATNAAQDAKNAIDDMQAFISQFGNAESYDNSKLYKVNNMVELDGSGFICIKDTQGNPPPTLPTKRNEWWQLFAQRGTDGTGAVSKVAGKSPEVDGNVSLTAQDIGAASSDDLIELKNQVSEHFADHSANVKDFGAIGDGITDDTVAIQDAMFSGIKKIFFPSGTYLISNTLRIPSNLTLVGMGLNTILKANNLNSNKQLLMNQNVIGEANVYIDRNIKIVSICFDGANLLDRTFEFLSFVKVEGLLVENCYFQNIKGMCLGATGSKDIIIENSTFRNNGHQKPSTISSPCIWMDKQGENLVKNVTIINCTFENNNWSGCYFMPENGKIINSNFINNGESSIFVNSNGKGIILENNYIKGAKRSNISASGIEIGSSETIIRGNIIEFCDSDGISITDSENVIVADNIIRNNGQDSAYFTTASGVAIISQGTSTPQNIKISNNRISDNQAEKKQKYGVCIGGSGASVKGVELLDNNLIDYTEEDAIYIADGKWGEGCYTSNNLGHPSQRPAVGRFKAPSTPGDISIGNVGFKPRYITFFAVEPSGSAIYNSNGETNGVDSKCSYYSSNNGTSAASVVDDKVIAIKGTDGDERCSASLVSLNQDGFTLNFSSTVTQPYITFVAHP